ncbi:hypothetical protein [Dictyobacter vulcani]|nr:hypothetical protein [Dictyobacter vulcani]
MLFPLQQAAAVVESLEGDGDVGFESDAEQVGGAFALGEFVGHVAFFG